MKTLLWLDDVRDPHTDDWLNFSPIGRGCRVVWVKSYTEFVSYIVFNGLPDKILKDAFKFVDSKHKEITNKWFEFFGKKQKPKFEKITRKL